MTKPASTRSRRRFLQQIAIGATAGSLSSRVFAADGNQNPKIKIGQIGVGHAHASGKMQTMRNFSELFEVVGIVEPDEKLKSTRGKHAAYQDLKWMTEEQLLNTPGLQAVAVETEVKDLLATGQRCVEAGMHIHLDKAPGESLSTFRKLLSTADANKLTVQLGYMLRYNPCFQFAYEWARSGRLGKVHTVHAEMSKLVSPAARSQLARYRGGAMFELGCHILDSVTYILGEPSSINTLAVKSGDGELVDNQVALLGYPSASAVLRSAVNEVDGSARRQFHVMGTEGQIGISPLEGYGLRLALTQKVGKYDKGIHNIRFPKQGRYDGEFHDLASVIRGEKKLAWSSSHDLMTQKTLLKICGLPNN